jgi:2-keto-4-pentenoate hydratase/2-oxohepta-3-ene-1,7-dioic acid hydratase in catechol pathway
MRNWFYYAFLRSQNEVVVVQRIDDRRGAEVIGDELPISHRARLTLLDTSAGDYLMLLARDARSPALDGLSFDPVIPRPEKIVCAVRNYLDHHHEVIAAGLASELSEYPPIFLRVWRSQVGHLQPIVRPTVSESLDWEGEMAVIIGIGGRDIPVDQARRHIAGYSCYNDASIREWQFHAKQIAAGKNFENTGAFGPWMVTADEVSLDDAKVETRLNGETVQSGDTSQLIFSVERLINYASTIFTLVPGDVIVSGTPAGVGWSRKPPRFMKPGDIVEVEVDGLGTLVNPITAQAT